MLIEKFGIVMIENNSVLLCKPHAFPDLITVGGIKEGSETHLENFRREVFEELGSDAKLDEESVKFLGRFSDRAAGKSERIVNIDLYIGKIFGKLHASSEISDLVWLNPRNLHSFTLSAVVKNKIIPFLLAEKYIDWNL